MRDLENRADIEAVLIAFYSAAITDEIIGPHFTEPVPIDLEAHLPHIADFWESILFGSRIYTKNVMALHADIHQRQAIRKEQLDRWVQLLTRAITAQFEGPKATLMLQRAVSVATLMDIKFNHSKTGL